MDFRLRPSYKIELIFISKMHSISKITTMDYYRYLKYNLVFQHLFSTPTVEQDHSPLRWFWCRWRSFHMFFIILSVCHGRRNAENGMKWIRNQHTRADNEKRTILMSNRRSPHVIRRILQFLKLKSKALLSTVSNQCCPIGIFSTHRNN